MFGLNPMTHRIWLGGLVLVLMISLVPTASAVYEDILYETWEQDVLDWPFTTDGNTWQYFPDPFSPSNPTWDVEYEGVYHVSIPGAVQSVWCVGSNDQLQAGVDHYPPNVSSYLFWGPFDLSDAIYAAGDFWYWSKMESNQLNSGDFFRVAVRQGGFSPNIGDWDFLFMQDLEGTGTWESAEFNFDEVVDGVTGETISYLGLNNLTIALYFYSDFDVVADNHWGVFVDEFFFGKDDGLFDFEIIDVRFVDPNDNSYVYEHLFVGQPVQVLFDFMAFGTGMSGVVDHTLYDPNNNVADVITQAWAGSRNGILYSELFAPVYNPTAPGQVSITVLLNSEFSQPEADYTNNDMTITTTIFPENLPPTLTFIQPPDGGMVVPPDAEDVEIIWEAFNQPDVEDAYIDLYWDYDDEGYDGSTISTNILIENGEDSYTWPLIGFPTDTDYYIYAIIEDGFNDPDSLYAPGSIFYGVGVDDESPVNVPNEFEILSAYPNPFNPTVEVRYAMPTPGNVTASWYTVEGRLVERTAFGRQPAGEHAFAWTPDNLTSGVYLLQLQSPAGVVNQKVTYLK